MYIILKVHPVVDPEILRFARVADNDELDCVAPLITRQGRYPAMTLENRGGRPSSPQWWIRHWVHPSGSWCILPTSLNLLSENQLRPTASPSRCRLSLHLHPIVQAVCIQLQPLDNSNNSVVIIWVKFRRKKNKWIFLYRKNAFYLSNMGRGRYAEPNSHCFVSHLHTRTVTI